MRDTASVVLRREPLTSALYDDFVQRSEEAQKRRTKTIGSHGFYAPVLCEADNSCVWIG